MLFTKKTIRSFPIPILFLAFPLLAGFIIIILWYSQQGSQIDLSNFDLAKGQQVYNNLCTVCHTSGMFGAPKLGEKTVWKTRFARGGMDTLIEHSINGYNSMPAKGGDTSLSDEEVKNAVAFIISSM
jgi:cytochrome c5